MERRGMIMAKVAVNFKLDVDLKNRLENLSEEMGMNLTTLFTIFAKKVDREKRIPFEIEAFDPFYSTGNQNRLRESLEQAKRGELKTMIMEDLEKYAD